MKRFYIRIDDRFTESLKAMERLDKVDWSSIETCEQLSNDFKVQVAAFTENYHTTLGSWKRKNIDLEAKYESTVLWVKMFNETSQRLKEEFSKVQTVNRKNIESICDYLDLQNKKDHQDEQDRQTVSLMAAPEQATGSPSSGWDLHKKA